MSLNMCAELLTSVIVRDDRGGDDGLGAASQ